MLSLSRPPPSRCLASRQGSSARPAVSSTFLLQGQRRRLRPVAATPGESGKDFGLAPESGTGGSGLGRSQGTARPLSGADNADLGSAPESGTRAAEGTPSSTGSASEGTWSAQQAGQDMRSPTGGSSSSLTGQAAGGPQEVSAGWEVPSSDTNPAMDPAESKMYTERETQGSTSVPSGGSGSQASAEPRAMRQQGSGSGQTQGRDESDRQMGGEGSGGSDTRTHPVARTAATAIGSAAGTILGAVGGPVGAAAGAALGGGAARRIADALGGDKGQAEVYDQGAEPEQVAEELLGARAAVGERLEGARDAAGDLADDIKERAQEAKELVQDKLDRASERTEDATQDAKQQMNKQQGRARDDQSNLQGGIGSRVQFAGEESGRGDTGGSGSHEHGKGLGGAIADAAKTAAQKMGSAADAVTGHAQFPEFPPAEGKASEFGTMKAADNLGDAAKSAANKVASAGEGVPLPEYPPAEGKASNYDNIGSGSKGEQGQTDKDSTASSAGGYSDGKSVGDWVRESADALGDSIADTAGAAAERLGVSSEQEKSPAGGLGDAVRSTVRTAADFGSPETSERLTEMSAQSEQQQGLQDSSSSSRGGGGSSGSTGGLQEDITWGDVSGLSDALGMGEPVEGGYYAYRSTDDLPREFDSSSSSSDPLSSRSFRRRSARGSRGATDPSPFTPHSVDGLATAATQTAAASGGVPSDAADVSHAAATAAAFGGDLSAIAGEGGSGQSGDRARGSETAMPATASAAGATDPGWDTSDQKWDWGGLPNPEAAVKVDVGAPSLMQQDGMDLAGALGTGEGLARRDSERVGPLDAAAAGGEERTADSGAPSLGRADGMGMAGAVGGAGGYGGGASEFGEGMDQMRAQGSGSGAAEPQVRSAGRGEGGQQGPGRVGVQAVDEGLPEGQLAAGGDDAQAAVGVRRDESAGAATSDSTAERVAQVYGLGPEASGGVEEANVYVKEAGQEEQKDEGASKAFEGA